VIKTTRRVDNIGAFLNFEKLEIFKNIEKIDSFIDGVPPIFIVTAQVNFIYYCYYFFLFIFLFF
jgi:hypothetical protein